MLPEINPSKSAPRNTGPFCGGGTLRIAYTRAESILAKRPHLTPIRPHHLALLLVSIHLASCGGYADASSRGPGQAVIGAAGTPSGPLLVAADGRFAPHAMARPDGSAEGFNVDLAAEIADRLGRPGYEIVDQEFSGVFAGLNAGRFEFIVAPTRRRSSGERSA